MLRVIQEVRPTWIIGENVAGIGSLFQYEVFSELEGKEYSSRKEAKADFKGICERTGQNSLWVVVDDLEKLGYEVQPFTIPACAVNAPHRRDRVWIVANYSEQGLPKPGPSRIGELQKKSKAGVHDRLKQQDSNAANSNRLNGDNARFNPSKISQFKEAEIQGLSNAPNVQGKRLQGGIKTDRSKRQKPDDKFMYGCSREWSEPWIEAATRLCRVDDGVSKVLDRTNRLKALGNAICPQVVVPIMQAIKDLEEMGGQK